MSRYAYLGIDPAGRRVRGREAAASIAALKLALEGRGIALLEADPFEGKAKPSRHAADQLRALATLVAAGVPVSRGLAEVERTAPVALAPTLAAVRHSVEQGDALSAALAEERGIADPFQLALIRAGEETGDLSGALDRVATLAEEERALRAEILTGMIYPALLATVGGASLLVMLVFVVPRFRALFEGTSASLPRATQVLLQASSFLTQNAPALLAVGVVALTTSAVLGTTGSGRDVLARLTLRMPLIGPIRRVQLRARFARLSASLVAGGAPIGSVLGSIVGALGDPVASEQAREVAEAVRAGRSLSEALAASELLQGSLPRLVAIGEQTGRLGAMLEAAAESDETALRRQIARLTKLVEPAMTVLFGLVVGLIAVALLQAVYGVNASALR